MDYSRLSFRSANSVYLLSPDIPIVDAAIPKQVNSSDIVRAHILVGRLLVDLINTISMIHIRKVLEGELIHSVPLIALIRCLRNVFITNPDGSEYIGQVWPGYTVS